MSPLSGRISGTYVLTTWFRKCLCMIGRHIDVALDIMLFFLFMAIFHVVGRQWVSCVQVGRPLFISNYSSVDASYAIATILKRMV